ncbi:MAG: tyrosine-type recombinase/integrase [Treponema sp.]|nr:tyrosine-type recombinase/integrase [Treponema sp.]
MNALATRAGNDIKEMATILAAYPAPEKWTQAQRTQAVQFAALLDTAQKMILAANLIGIDYHTEKETFLANAGKTQSTHTHTAYRSAIGRLDAWAGRQKINPLELTPAQADDFIYSLRGERSAASIRLDISAVSSFFTWLERRHASIKNPFRGTKARPAKKAAKETVIPSAAEVDTIVRQLPSDLAAAVAIMAYRGLRAGALPSLSVSGGKFSGYSKGKDITGALPPEALEAIKAAGLPFRGPFAGVIPNTLEKRIVRAIEKLHKAGEVQGVYSAHDFRHFYSITEYRKDKDIHRVSKLLGHASILVTENYLKGLGEVG